MKRTAAKIAYEVVGSSVSDEDIAMVQVAFYEVWREALSQSADKAANTAMRPHEEGDVNYEAGMKYMLATITDRIMALRDSKKPEDF